MQIVDKWNYFFKKSEAMLINESVKMFAFLVLLLIIVLLLTLQCHYQDFAQTTSLFPVYKY